MVSQVVCAGKKRTGVIDFNLSNTSSVIRALDFADIEAVVLTEAAQFASVDNIILPGVGSFDAGMTSLKSKNLDKALKENVLEKKKPILGICLGLQLLGCSSCEGAVEGLGIIKGNSVPLETKIGSTSKLPHTGWNKVKIIRDQTFFRKLGNSPSFYFNHSYHFIPKDKRNILGVADELIEINSIIRFEHIFGVQFHPEKSYEFGRLLFEIFNSYDA